MAVTIIPKATRHFQKYTVTFTADGDAVLSFPVLPKCLTITSDGVDGGGTLSWLVSNDGATYTAFGMAASATPATATVTTATAAGNWVSLAHSAGWESLKLSLASSTNPTLVVTVMAKF